MINHTTKRLKQNPTKFDVLQTWNKTQIILNLVYAYTLVYLIAEQDVLREQDGIMLEKIKLAGSNKGAEWNIL